MGHSLNIVSYNILHPRFAIYNSVPEGTRLLPDGKRESNWSERYPQVAANLLGADVVCLQETDPTLTNMVCGTFNPLVHAHHMHDGRPACHGTALLARTGSGLPLETMTWTPYGESARAAAVMLFELPKSGPRILITSVHPDGYWDGEQDPKELEASKEKGYRELQLVVRQAELYKPQVDAIVIAGDYNEHHSPPGVAFNRHVLLESHGYADDQHLAASEPATRRKIDWIYVWSKQPVQLEPHYDYPPFPQASDHVPVGTKLVFG